jgi:hypothetical protein
VEPARGVPALALILSTAAAARAGEAPRGALDAEMLRDLDMLGSPSYPRDRELGRTLGLVERLRLLERLRRMEIEPPALPVTQPAVPPTAPREVK